MEGNVDAGLAYISLQPKIIASIREHDHVNIDHTEIKAALDLNGVEDQPDCFQRLSRLFSDLPDEIELL